MHKETRIKHLLESVMLKEEDSTSDAFQLLDDARTSLQDAQSNLYIKMPQAYQSLYALELKSIYDHANAAIAEVQALAKKIHAETGK
jgi:hypothetical protein